MQCLLVAIAEKAVFWVEGTKATSAGGDADQHTNTDTNIDTRRYKYRHRHKQATQSTSAGDGAANWSVVKHKYN